MIEWRTDFENAPRGLQEKRTFLHHQSGKVLGKELTSRVSVLISCGNQVLQSHWSDKRQQWVGLATGEKPDGWAEWPKPMKGLDQ